MLYRTNSQSLSIEDALRRNNIPYGLVGGVAFYRRKEVKDALAYLRLVVNERDDESFARAVNTPARGVGETTMKRLRAAATNRGIPMFEAARHPETIPDLTPRVGNVLAKFTEMVDLYRNHVDDMPTAELARTLLSESGLLQSYKDEGTPEAIATPMHKGMATRKTMIEATTSWPKKRSGGKPPRPSRAGVVWLVMRVAPHGCARSHAPRSRRMAAS